MLRAYRMHGPVGSTASSPRSPADISELLYQIQTLPRLPLGQRRLLQRLLIHNIDECCWMKDAWPVEAKAIGGRHYRGDNIDQNFDTYSVEYTFADGAKLFLEGRNMRRLRPASSPATPTAPKARRSSLGGHTPAKCRIFQART